MSLIEDIEMALIKLKNDVIKQQPVQSYIQHAAALRGFPSNGAKTVGLRRPNHHPLDPKKPSFRLIS
jgi:hypothetical protein